MPTIYDVALKSGYSATTVSKAFNDYSDISTKTKQEILKVAKEMGYLPNSHARTLLTKKSWMVGVLYVEPFGMGIKHPFFNAVIESFKERMEYKSYDLMFISKDIGKKEFSYLKHCQFRSIDGVIIVQSEYHNEEVQELLNSDIPCVLIDMESEQASTVCSDNIRGGFEAVHYFYNLGHRHIAHISGGDDTFSGPKRREGFKQALKQYGLPVKDEWIVDGGYFTYDSGYEAMQKLLNLADRPTAVFVAGDYMALGAIQAIKDSGLRVPQDISVIGFDDIELAQYVTPKLTTIRQNTNCIGRKAADILIDAIDNNKKSNTKTMIPTELIVRESCQKI